MSSAVAELDAHLQSMLNLKPPGVSTSKMPIITALCSANIQSESVLIQKLYTHFKKAPSTHKLGVLYVVDAVTRQWADQARKSGSGSSDGTFAAGVNRVTELLPVLMNDIINSAPSEQKVKIEKLIDIWEKSSIFPAAMLSSFKEKLHAPAMTSVTSTTPEGSPSPDALSLGQQQRANPVHSAPIQQDTSAILEAIRNMANQNATVSPAVGVPGQASMNHLLGAQNGNPQSTSTVNQGPSALTGQAVNPLGALFPGLSSGAQNQSTANVPPNPLAAFLPQPQAPAPLPNAAPLAQQAQAQQLQLLQLMAQQGIPPDQWGAALQLLNIQTANQTNSLPFAPPLPQSAGNVWQSQNGGSSRDRDPYTTRSPPSQYRDRERRRSRSPDFRGGRRDASPRRRRDSPSYDQYRNQNDRGGRRGNDYRQRSPPRHTTPPQADQALPPPGPKYIEIDHNLPKGTIKVLSRTLFVGGVTSSEAHLRSLFAKFGIVQTCIVNVDKRHAFVKMINRTDAVAAREGMEEYKTGETQLRTKWGVGFGPRDCSDYQTGISVIPIDRLTDADRKWMLTAEYGGTGGRQIENGMIVEEPDIEIGAGVSSKAMSRRIATDQGGKRGPQSSRGGNLGSSRRDDRHRDDDRDRNGNYHNDRPTSSSHSNTNGTVPPLPIPGFNMNGMNFPALPNGMPMFPAGFPFQFPQMQMPPTSRQD